MACPAADRSEIGSLEAAAPTILSSPNVTGLEHLESWMNAAGDTHPLCVDHFSSGMASCKQTGLNIPRKKLGRGVVSVCIHASATRAACNMSTTLCCGTRVSDSTQHPRNNNAFSLATIASKRGEKDSPAAWGALTCNPEHSRPFGVPVDDGLESSVI